jgi:hypothetical protein
MSFQDVDDFKSVFDVAKENHIASKCEAADIVSQFGAWAPHKTRQICQFTAFLPEFCNEVLTLRQ